MAKRNYFFSGAIIVLLLGISFTAWAYIDERNRNRERITELEQDQAEMLTLRDRLNEQNAQLEMQRDELQAQVMSLQGEVGDRLAQVEELEDELETARSTQFTSTRPAEYREKIAQFYPEMAGSDWGVFQARDENGLIGNYLKVPLGMADAFMLQETRADIREAQNEQLTNTVELQQQIIGLQGEISDLERQRADAWREGFDTASTAYLSVNEELRDQLGKARFRLELPKRGTLVGTTVLGLLIGAGL